MSRSHIVPIAAAAAATSLLLLSFYMTAQSFNGRRLIKGGGSVSRRRKNEKEEEKEEEEEEGSYLTPAVKNLLFVHKLLDVLERDILPLSCEGACTGQPVRGAAIVTSSAWGKHRDGQLVSAASSQEAVCPLYQCELLCLEEAVRVLRRKSSRRAGSLSTPQMLSECVLLCSHMPDVFCVEAAKKCGIENIYFLFDGEDVVVQGQGQGEKNDGSSAAKGGVSFDFTNSPSLTSTSPISYITDPQRSVKIKSISKQICKLEKRRAFDSEEEMQKVLYCDQKTAEAQMRVLNLQNIYRNLHLEAARSLQQIQEKEENAHGWRFWSSPLTLTKEAK